jgi:hypothetical protein
MTQYGATGGTGNLAFHVTHCKKIACEKATSQAGYICDFTAGFSSPGATMPGSLGAMFSNGDMGQGRFVHTGEGWLFIPLRE